MGFRPKISKTVAALVCAISFALACAGASFAQPPDPAIAVYVEQVPTATGKSLAEPVQGGATALDFTPAQHRAAGHDASALEALGASSPPLRRTAAPAGVPSGPAPIAQPAAGGGSARLIVLVLLAALVAAAAIAARVAGRRGAER